MGDTNLANISSDECSKIYKTIIKNSEEKYTEAQFLAKKRRYDTASALLIVSNEELLKGLIIFLAGQGIDLRKIAGMNGLLKNHKLRFLTALLISILEISLSDIFKFVLSIISNSKSFSKKIENLNFHSELKKFFEYRLADIKEEIRFFSKFDKIRQQGLYIDYDNGIKSITKREYNALHKKICGLSEIISYFIKDFSNNKKGFKEELLKMKDEFNSQHIQALVEILAQINKPKFDSYKALENYIDVMYKDIVEDKEFENFVNGDGENIGVAGHLKRLASKLSLI